MWTELSHRIAALWTDGRRVERIAYVVAAVLVASGLFHLGVFAIDGGPWTGPVSWRKPVTFGLSFGITLAALTWVGGYLRLGAALRRVLIGVLAVVAAAEVTGITVQAWRGVPSHFNEDGGLSSAVTTMLAIGGTVLVATILTLTVASFRPAPDTAASMRLAVRAGLVVLMAAMVSGAVMIATGVALSRGGDPQAAYETAGWLKPTHFATMHAVVVLPALAFWLSCLRMDEARRTRIVALATAAYVLAALVTAAVNVAIGR